MRAMSKDPAILFYTSDFLTGTILMNNEQVGMYIKLLCIQHQKGNLTEKDMLNICKTYDEEVFCKFTKDTDGLYYNNRLREEIEKRKNYSESRRNNRLGSKKPKKICKTYDKHMEDVNENRNRSINKVKDFYTSEISKIEPNSKLEYGYKQISTLITEGNETTDLKTLQAIRDQLTFSQYEKLRAKHEHKGIVESLTAMSNKKEYYTKYLSIYKTLTTWMKS